MDVNGGEVSPQILETSERPGVCASPPFTSDRGIVVYSVMMVPVLAKIGNKDNWLVSKMNKPGTEDKDPAVRDITIVCFDDGISFSGWLFFQQLRWLSWIVVCGIPVAHPCRSGSHGPVDWSTVIDVVSSPSSRGAVFILRVCKRRKREVLIWRCKKITSKGRQGVIETGVETG